MLLTFTVLVGLLAAASINLVRPQPVPALALGVLCGIWLRVNNNHLEGPILWKIDDYRGLSTADLASYGGFAISLTSVHRWRRMLPESRRRRAAWTATLLTIGLVAAISLDWFVQSV